MSKPLDTVPPSPPQQPVDSVETHLQVRERRTEREPNEVVAGRVEEVSTVRGVDVEEDSWNHDRLFFEELFDEGLVCDGLVGDQNWEGVEGTYETVVQGWGKVIQVQPDIERGDRWELHFQPQLLKPGKNVVSFRLEVFLQSQLHNTIPQ